MLHQWLGTMMPGADGHTLFIQYGADIVRMNPLDRKGDNSCRVVGAEQRDGID